MHYHEEETAEKTAEWMGTVAYGSQFYILGSLSRPNPSTKDLQPTQSEPKTASSQPQRKRRLFHRH